MALVAENLLWIVHEVGNTVEGGSILTDDFVTRPLNVVKLNQIAGASLAANIITLPAGTYWLEAHQSTYSVGDVCAFRLFNVDDMTDAVRGVNGFGTDRGDTYPMRGQFTIAEEKDFRMDVYSGSAQAGSGMGFQQQEASHVETYCIVRIWRRAD